MHFLSLVIKIIHHQKLKISDKYFHHKYMYFAIKNSISLRFNDIFASSFDNSAHTTLTLNVINSQEISIA